jgi:sugar/nucleoside kinase (ribokinase family)
MKIKKENLVCVVGPTYLDNCFYLRGNLLFDGSTPVKTEFKIPGGTGFCYALALNNMGNSVLLSSRIGSDKEGNLIKKFALKNKIKARWQIDKGRTDQAIVLIGRNNQKVIASIRKISKNWVLEENLKKELIKARCLVITSFCNNILCKIITFLSENTMAKPFVFWAPNANNCKEIEKLKSSLKYIDHLSLSQTEYDIFQRKIKDPFKLGVKSLTVTNGKNGCLLILESKIFSFPAAKIINHPQDTNGAGEAFGAAYLTTFLKTKNYEKSAKIGNLYAYRYLLNTKRGFPKINLFNLKINDR